MAHLRYIFPLSPTLATLNGRPSRLVGVASFNSLLIWLWLFFVDLERKTSLLFLTRLREF